MLTVTKKGLSAVTTTGNTDFLGSLGTSFVKLIDTVVPSVVTSFTQQSLIEKQNELATTQLSTSKLMADIESRTNTAQIEALKIQAETDKAKQMSQIITIAIVGVAVLSGGYLIMKKGKK